MGTNKQILLVREYLRPEGSKPHQIPWGAFKTTHVHYPAPNVLIQLLFLGYLYERAFTFIQSDQFIHSIDIY